MPSLLFAESDAISFVCADQHESATAILGKSDVAVVDTTFLIVTNESASAISVGASTHGVVSGMRGGCVDGFRFFYLLRPHLGSLHSHMVTPETFGG